MFRLILLILLSLISLGCEFGHGDVYRSKEYRDNRRNNYRENNHEYKK